MLMHKEKSYYMKYSRSLICNYSSLPIRFLLIKYVGLIVFTVFSLKYGLLSGYELLGFWAIFMLRTLLLIVAQIERNSPFAVWLE